MQNEELKAARLEAEQGLERYNEVFDFPRSDSPSSPLTSASS
jgi:hypothetical protein